MWVARGHTPQHTVSNYTASQETTVGVACPRLYKSYCSFYTKMNVYLTKLTKKGSNLYTLTGALAVNCTEISSMQMQYK